MKMFSVKEMYIFFHPFIYIFNLSIQRIAFFSSSTFRAILLAECQFDHENKKLSQYNIYPQFKKLKKFNRVCETKKEQHLHLYKNFSRKIQLSSSNILCTLQCPLTAIY